MHADFVVGVEEDIVMTLGIGVNKAVIVHPTIVQMEEVWVERPVIHPVVMEPQQVPLVPIIVHQEGLFQGQHVLRSVVMVLQVHVRIHAHQEGPCQGQHVLFLKERIRITHVLLEDPCQGRPARFRQEGLRNMDVPMEEVW